MCDVHLSFKVVAAFQEMGFEAIHVNGVLSGCTTPDSEIARYADENDFTMVSKDADFKNGFFIMNSPKKLIRICLGNISTSDLIQILKNNLDLIKSLQKHKTFLVEINSSEIISILPELNE